jgi:hypothetical protein
MGFIDPVILPALSSVARNSKQLITQAAVSAAFSIIKRRKTRKPWRF